MIIDKKSKKHIIADEGKGFWRKEDNSGPFSEVIFGNYQFKDGIRLETVDDFEELLLPEENIEDMHE